jgi:hypothetical protein
VELPLALLGLLIGGAPVVDAPTVLWALDSGVARADHGAALMPDGRVMVVGGSASRSTQLYDPASNSWSDGGRGMDSHAFYSLARLQDGTLIVVDNGPFYEWWLPATQSWDVAPPGTPRQEGVAVLLSSGQLLTGCGNDGTGSVDTFERFDQESNVWLDAGAQLFPDDLCALSPLPGDRWLKTGGVGSASDVAELWSADGGRPYTLQYDRQEHTSTILPDGRVLVTGGTSSPFPVEIFDPVTETWEAPGSSPSEGRFAASATVLPDGRVVVAGGFNGSGRAVDTGEVYDPLTGLWSAPFQLGLRRGVHVGVMLPNGRVFLTGGDDDVSSTQSSQLLDFSSPFMTAGPGLPQPMAAPRLGTARGVPVLWDDHGTAAYRLNPEAGWVALPPAPANPGAVALTLRDGRLLRVGAAIDGYDPERGAWFTVPTPDAGHPGAAAALLRTGEVLVAGGDGPSKGVELFDPRTATWSRTEDLPTATRGAQAVSLPGGDVLLCGGETGTGLTDWCWIYTASTAHWTFGVRFSGARRGFSLTPLESGLVLAAGGENDGGVVATAEVFRPSSISWTPAGSLLQPRAGHAAVRLRNGQVLVIGGSGTTGALLTTERFDLVMGGFTGGPDLGVARAAPSAVMGMDGRPLICGAEDVRVEVFDEGRGAQPEWAPTLEGPPRGSPGQALTVTGTRITGVTPGSSGDLRNSPSNLPVLALEGPDDLLVRPGAIGWTDSRVTFQVPPSTAAGWYALSASVNGIESEAKPFVVGLDTGQSCDAGAECAAGTCAAGICADPPEIIWVPPDSGTVTDGGADAGGGPPLEVDVGCGCAAAPGAWGALILLIALRAGVSRARRAKRARD